jgi:ribonuclease R
MTENYQRQILKTLSNRNYRPAKLPSLAKAIGVSDKDYPAFKMAFNQLRDGRKAVSGPNGFITLPAMSSKPVGTFRANPAGFGFVVPNQAAAGGDLFIAPEDTAGAMSGDTVVAKVLKKDHRGGQLRYSGKIVDILQRSRKKIVGTLKQAGDKWLVAPDGKEFFDAIAVDDITAKNAKVKDKVIVEIIEYPTANQGPRGVIVDVLGKAGQYDAEIKSIIAQYNIPEEFTDESLDQAASAAGKLDTDTAGQREDISDQVVITIDPPDARDFDDAISISRNKDGNWVLGVHIADVSSFIPMASALDIQAKQRGNSVYLPGKVIPMLPEVLSNGVCSLQQGQKRWVKSAYITYDRQGTVLGREFANSTICSTARLTYTQADDILHGKTGSIDGKVVALVKDMETLARAIEKRRTKNGMLHLDLPEIELIYNESGMVTDAEPAENSYPHTIIEMFMVEANEAVAAMLDRFNVPFMRRVHPDPDQVTIKDAGQSIKLCGLKVPKKLDRAAIIDLLAAAKGTSHSYAINMYILRSLARAEYGPQHSGHFALASKHYCHFTSPIRRYADLMIHRLLQCHLEHRLNMIGLDEVLPAGELTEIGKDITFTEKRAESAERELKTVLLLQMLSKHIGDELNCVISGLTNFGLFVQCLKFGIEGMIELSDLGSDQWRFNQKSQAVVGRYSGKSIQLGQEMKVKIVSVNVAARQLDVIPAEPLVATREELNKPGGGKRGKNKRKGKRRN